MQADLTLLPTLNIIYGHGYYSALSVTQHTIVQRICADSAHNIIIITRNDDCNEYGGMRLLRLPVTLTLLPKKPGKEKKFRTSNLFNIYLLHSICVIIPKSEKSIQFPLPKTLYLLGGETCGHILPSRLSNGALGRKPSGNDFCFLFILFYNSQKWTMIITALLLGQRISVNLFRTRTIKIKRVIPIT